MNFAGTPPKVDDIVPPNAKFQVTTFVRGGGRAATLLDGLSLDHPCSPSRRAGHLLGHITAEQTRAELWLNQRGNRIARRSSTLIARNGRTLLGLICCLTFAVSAVLAQDAKVVEVSPAAASSSDGPSSRPQRQARRRQGRRSQSGQGRPASRAKAWRTEARRAKTGRTETRRAEGGRTRRHATAHEARKAGQPRRAQGPPRCRGQGSLQLQRPAVAGRARMAGDDLEHEPRLAGAARRFPQPDDAAGATRSPKPAT